MHDAVNHQISIFEAEEKSMEDWDMAERKGEWKPYGNVINGKKMYIAGRQLDLSQPLHSGNVEHCGQYSENFKEVQERCDGLNAVNLKGRL
jgi:hypothetical protein